MPLPQLETYERLFISLEIGTLLLSHAYGGARNSIHKGKIKTLFKKKSKKSINGISIIK